MWLKTSMKLYSTLRKCDVGWVWSKSHATAAPLGKVFPLKCQFQNQRLTELTVARVWERRCTGSKLPCSSLKHRERLAASISGVGLSRTCLHHCKGLRDFSDDVNVFEEPTYNLKKRNLHYRYYIGIWTWPPF